MPTHPDTAACSAIILRGRSMLRAAVSLLANGYERHRQRLNLAELDARLLEDIGVTREEARHESRLPFWRFGSRS